MKPPYASGTTSIVALPDDADARHDLAEPEAAQHAVDGSAASPMPMAPMMAKAEMSRVPIEAGQLAVQHRVRVIFAIDRSDGEHP